MKGAKKGFKGVTLPEGLPPPIKLCIPTLLGFKKILKGPCLFCFDLKVLRGVCYPINMFAREDVAVTHDLTHSCFFVVLFLCLFFAISILESHSNWSKENCFLRCKINSSSITLRFCEVNVDLQVQLWVIGTNLPMWATFHLRYNQNVASEDCNCLNMHTIIYSHLKWLCCVFFFIPIE